MEFKEFINKVIQSIDNWDGTVSCRTSFNSESYILYYASMHYTYRDPNFTLAWRDNKVELINQGIIVDTFYVDKFEFKHAMIDIKRACDESFKRNIRNLLGIDRI